MKALLLLVTDVAINQDKYMISGNQPIVCRNDLVEILVQDRQEVL